MSSLEVREGINNWLDTHFERKSPYSTVGDFQRKIEERFQQEMAQPWQQLREKLREMLGINGPAVVFGEQSVGLNEPSVILGKRIVAACLTGIGAYDYRAQTDVAGSEPGLHSVTVPNPYKRDGVESVAILPDRVRDLPTLNIPPSEFNQKALFGFLDKIYSRKNPRYARLINLIEYLQQQNPSMADFNDQLFTNLCEEIGLPYFPRVTDYKFDTYSFINGGGELIMEYWTRIIKEARKAHYHLGKTYCRVPEKDEAPFFIIVPNQPHPRARILWDREREVFWGVHPQNSQKIVIPEIPSNELLDEIKKGTIRIAWRAIPRAIILATAFDGHISGGGALYNKVVAPVFEELTGVPYYPIAFLSPINEQDEGILQYKSTACRKTSAPYIAQANQAVRANRISLYDFHLSIEPKVVQQILSDLIRSNQGVLPLSTRIIFPDNVFIHS